jgi:hypothetical protein
MAIGVFPFPPTSMLPIEITVSRAPSGVDPCPEAAAGMRDDLIRADLTNPETTPYRREPGIIASDNGPPSGSLCNSFDRP